MGQRSWDKRRIHTTQGQREPGHEDVEGAPLGPRPELAVVQGLPQLGPRGQRGGGVTARPRGSVAPNLGARWDLRGGALLVELRRSGNVIIASRDSLDLKTIYELTMKRRQGCNFFCWNRRKIAIPGLMLYTIYTVYHRYIEYLILYTMSHGCLID